METPFDKPASSLAAGEIRVSEQQWRRLHSTLTEIETESARLQRELEESKQTVLQQETELSKAHQELEEMRLVAAHAIDPGDAQQLPESLKSAELIMDQLKAVVPPLSPECATTATLLIAQHLNVVEALRQRAAESVDSQPELPGDMDQLVRGLTRELKGYQNAQGIRLLARAYTGAPITQQLIEARRTWPADIQFYVSRLEMELRVVQEIAQPEWAVHFPVAAIRAVVLLREEADKAKRELLELKLKVEQCICEKSTDECCPQCIPGVPTDIFQRYAAAVKLIEKVRAVATSSAFVSVFQMSQLHHAAYRGENWKAELDEFDRACGREPEPERVIGETVMDGSKQLDTRETRTGA